LSMRNIGFKDVLRSKPVRLNFSEIESEFNALRAEVQASLASTAGEVTAARDNHASLSDNIHERRIYENGIYGTAAFGAAALHLTMSIYPGTGIVNGVGVDVSSTVTATAASPAAGKKRLDLVVIDTNNDIGILEGAEVAAASAYQYPAVSNTEEVLHMYRIYDTTSTVVLNDERQRLLHPYADEEYSNAFYTFNGETISTVTLQNSRGEEKYYKFNFSGETIASVGVAIDGKRYTHTYLFSGETIATISLSMS